MDKTQYQIRRIKKSKLKKGDFVEDTSTGETGCVEDYLFGTGGIMTYEVKFHSTQRTVNRFGSRLRLLIEPNTILKTIL